MPSIIISHFNSNFSHYKARFTMPERKLAKDSMEKDMFYSFNVGPVHFVSISSEYYYWPTKGWNFDTCVMRQYNWLLQDLEVS